MRVKALQLALLVDEAPEGDDWFHEQKFDGYRIVAEKAGRSVELLSRRFKDWTPQFPTVADAVGKVKAKQLVLDGEVAVVMPAGRTGFQPLPNPLRRNRIRPVHFTGLQRGQRRRRLGDEPEPHAGHTGRTVPVVRIGHQRDRVAALLSGEAERPAGRNAWGVGWAFGTRGTLMRAVGASSTTAGTEQNVSPSLHGQSMPGPQFWVASRWCA